MLKIMFFCTFRLLIYNRKFKKIREIAGFIPNPLRFHEKNLKSRSPTKNSLKPEPERIETCRNTMHWDENILLLKDVSLKLSTLWHEKKKSRKS